MAWKTANSVSTHIAHLMPGLSAERKFTFLRGAVLTIPNPLF